MPGFVDSERPPRGMAALPEGKAAIMSQTVAYDSGGNWPSGTTQ
ncbi:hypothetical protein BN975_05445 [Mycolicibacterium farcinogenes]|jgi:hypothetical protein|uniref:Uncharacterized protein n=2 Tax=Mycolicibacterium TaxID=1866885 RepID=A0A378SZB2_9MYCO|nr:hypothetical protein [Mycolicibacterium senegalense]CDP89584.1 hypothetical protein BN975_05445 [Mycolicibacterium farcinogenes]CQD15381.1 hypothetical protein BN970_03212 [Mycolicibacterium conceptionense]STZ52973.1 Uncharacterised protein [Mycolicibacterium senegalense]